MPSERDRGWADLHFTKEREREKEEQVRRGDLTHTILGPAPLLIWYASDDTILVLAA